MPGSFHGSPHRLTPMHHVMTDHARPPVAVPGPRVLIMSTKGETGLVRGLGPTKLFPVIIDIILISISDGNLDAAPPGQHRALSEHRR